MLSAHTILAGSATWKLNPPSGNWSNASNWTPTSVPNGPSDIASFGQTMRSSISVSVTNEVSRLSFLSGASQYTINVLPGTFIFKVSGVGITNDSGVTQNFVIAGGSVDMYGDIAFRNGATAGSLTNFTTNGSTISGGFGGLVHFSDTSTAGTANFVVNGSAVSDGSGGTLSFFDSSSAGGATFTTDGSLAEGAGSGTIQFSGNPVIPATANFTNRASEVSGGYGGYIAFYDTANAGSGHFTNVGPISEVSAYSGTTQFYQESSAGHATIDNLGGSIAGGSGGETDFLNTSTAGESTITLNNGSAFNGQGAIAEFFEESSAGDSHFIVKGSDVPAGFGGAAYFRSNSTAENGTFTMKGASVHIGSGGVTYFYDGGKPSAGNALFINEGGSVSGAAGGQTLFLYPSTAAHSTLIAQGGQVSGADGGAIYFYDGDGDAARIEVFRNGLLDISFHALPGVTIGSLEGSGLVYVGAQNLTVGSNGLNTAFSGIIQDGGVSDEFGGSFTKIGSGILTFQGGATNNHIGDTVNLAVTTGSTINLNFTGSPDTVRSLVAGGVARAPGLYGSAASGAPNPLPQFTGAGKVLVTMLAASRAGAFGVDLPLSGTPGIECRSGGVNNVYKIVVTFLNPVTFDSASVTSGTGMVTSATGSGTTTVTVNLSGVTNAQTIMVTLFGVNDAAGTNDITIPMSILIGDTNGNGTVNSTDVSQTKLRSGQAIGASNFRSDINANGVINATDVSSVKLKSGTSLPIPRAYTGEHRPPSL